jgi:hypothetical protein
MEPVAEEVLRLRFAGRYVESMYRNDERIRELFIGRIGSIASFSRSATKDVNGSVGFKGIAELAGTRGGEQAVEYNLTDPTAQALVLREILRSQANFTIVPMLCLASSSRSSAGPASAGLLTNRSRSTSMLVATRASSRSSPTSSGYVVFMRRRCD